MTRVRGGRVSRRAMLALIAASGPGLALASSAGAQGSATGGGAPPDRSAAEDTSTGRTWRGHPIPPENDWRGDRPARPPVGDAAQRAERLFQAILQDDPELARGFFFPQAPFRILKGIADPDRYWRVLYAHYERDIHALHEQVPAEATFDRLVMTRRGGWVERRQEANALPYWASRHDWIYYRVGDAERRFELHSLINWGPRWFITHLS